MNGKALPSQNRRVPIKSCFFACFANSFNKKNDSGNYSKDRNFMK